MGRLRAWILTAVAVVLATGALPARPAVGHVQLEDSAPAQDALLSVPPSVLSLRFTEPVEVAEVAVTAVDEAGRAVPLDPPALDPQDDRRVLVRSDGFSIGTYTVSWSNRSLTDGHPIAGSFAFRVGGTDRAPAAATVEGERPPGWGVVIRWLAFLGAAGAAGLLVVAPGGRRRRLVAAGLAVGALATLAEPVLLSRFPPAGSQGGSVGDAIRSAPDGWWVRLAGLLLALGALATPLGRRRRVVSAAALLAVGGLSLSSHAAGRESYATGAVALTFVHNATVALWVGGLSLIALAPVQDRWAELRGFARAALPLAGVAVAAGVGSAVLVLPSRDSLVDSDYGRVLLAKAAVVAAVLGLAAVHHRKVGRVAAGLVAGAPGLLRRSVRVELGLAALAVALASTMALLATPRISRGDLERLEFGMATAPTSLDDQVWVRLRVDPGLTGANDLAAYAVQGQPVRVEVDANGVARRVEAAPLTDVQLMRVEVTSLEYALPPRTSDMRPLGGGRFAGGGVDLSVDGWWRLRVTVRRAGVAEDVAAEVHLRTPDPNVAGFEETAPTTSDPAGERLYEAARAGFEAEPWSAYYEALSGSDGSATVTGFSYFARADGAAGPVVTIANQGLEIVRADGTRYISRDGGPWAADTDVPVGGPADWMTEYDGATGFRLGNVETVGGVEAQVLTFYVPRTALAPAFYVWWVDVATGRIVQLAMDSVSHFMTKRYDWTAPPPPVVIPAVSGP